MDTSSAMEKASEKVYHDAFRQRLKALRQELQWSQPQMATALGMPLENYKKYEARSKFPPHYYERLSLVCHKSLEFIVTGRSVNVTHFRRRSAS